MTSDPRPSPIGNYAFTVPLISHEFWSIWRGENTLTKTPVCIKVISKTIFSTHERRTQFFREVSSLRDTHHPLICELFETLEDSQSRYLVFEFAENGTFKQFLSSKGTLGENLSRTYFLQVIFALEYLHNERKTIHSVLTFDSIVLDRFNNIRLIDLGFRLHLLFNNQYSAAVLPAPWAAPELLRGHPFSRASDIWAVGILLYRMITGVLPFAELEGNVLSSEPPFPSGISADVVDLLRKLLAKSPDARITIEMIKKHHWFSQTQYGATLEAQFSRQRVSEAVIDKEIVRSMAALRLDVRQLPQQWIDREITPLTIVYRQFLRVNSINAFGVLMGEVMPQKQGQPPFKFQFPGGRRPSATLIAGAGKEGGGGTPAVTRSRPILTKEQFGAGKVPTRSLGQPTNVQVSQRRGSKPTLLRTVVTLQGKLPGQLGFSHEDK